MSASGIVRDCAKNYVSQEATLQPSSSPTFGVIPSICLHFAPTTQNGSEDKGPPYWFAPPLAKPLLCSRVHSLFCSPPLFSNPWRRSGRSKRASLLSCPIHHANVWRQAQTGHIIQSTQWMHLALSIFLSFTDTIYLHFKGIVTGIRITHGCKAFTSLFPDGSTAL